VTITEMLMECEITLTVRHRPTGFQASQRASGIEALQARDPVSVNRRLASECLRLLHESVEVAAPVSPPGAPE